MAGPTPNRCFICDAHCHHHINLIRKYTQSESAYKANHAPHHHHDSAMGRTCGEYRMSGSLCVERNERDTAILFVMHSGGYLSWGRLTSASKPYARAPVSYSAWPLKWDILKGYLVYCRPRWVLKSSPVVLALSVRTGILQTTSHTDPVLSDSTSFRITCIFGRSGMWIE